ncbi:MULTISPECIES: phage baseplate plug family protein [Acetobacter]|uniref:Cyanophage baseplate Pam3 plug gp18 domain-containing protein n=1 Tax=Acetobacter lovaniensis TaxID=104100 RepID=A0A841QHJ8_9PROT|nr:hypothetical protein [Acetobacter lovaniensis]MBB6457906.1 hypothetical protein [Acetobacter lovaniensis]NHN82167.1 hypothetical protein [Acetobacter lovaniensis]GBQ66207.1 hypothetical protein AA0474_1051 [Acetobacter lovaniensis NRIC 0474]
MADPVVIPLNAVAQQSVQVTLSSQSVQLDIQQRTTGLYMNIWLNGTMIIAGLLCQDRTWIVQKSYFGMPGDMMFADQEGKSDPDYSGLSGRYVLMYQEGVNV